MLEKITNQIGGYDYLFYDFILLIPLIIIGVVIAVVIGIMRKRKNANAKVKDGPQENLTEIKHDQNIKSLNIIKERLAKGEISKEEYDELKKEFE